MRPMAVLGPVPTTTPRARPDVTRVPCMVHGAWGLSQDVSHFQHAAIHIVAAHDGVSPTHTDTQPTCLTPMHAVHAVARPGRARASGLVTVCARGAARAHREHHVGLVLHHGVVYGHHLRVLVHAVGLAGQDGLYRSTAQRSTAWRACMHARTHCTTRCCMRGWLVLACMHAGRQACCAVHASRLHYTSAAGSWVWT